MQAHFVQGLQGVSVLQLRVLGNSYGGGGTGDGRLLARKDKNHNTLVVSRVNGRVGGENVEHGLIRSGKPKSALFNTFEHKMCGQNENEGLRFNSVPLSNHFPISRPIHHNRISFRIALQKIAMNAGGISECNCLRGRSDFYHGRSYVAQFNGTTEHYSRARFALVVI